MWRADLPMENKARQNQGKEGEAKGPPQLSPIHCTHGKREVGRDGKTIYEAREAPNGKMRWYVVRSTSSSSSSSNHDNNGKPPLHPYKPKFQQHQQQQQMKKDGNGMQIERIEVVHTNNNNRKSALF